MNEITHTKTDARRPLARPLFADMGAPIGWLRGEIDRLFDDVGQPTRALFDLGTRAIAPALEMTDEGKEYRLTAELPGLGDKDVEIEVADGVLSISGEKKMEDERKQDGYLLRERRYGSFKRQVSLPVDADAQAIKARFKDGLLTVTIAKDDRAQGSKRKIDIER